MSGQFCIPNCCRVVMKMVGIHSQVLPSGGRRITTIKNMVLI
jgi:hypothetical protein